MPLAFPALCTGQAVPGVWPLTFPLPQVCFHQDQECMGHADQAMLGSRVGHWERRVSGVQAWRHQGRVVYAGAGCLLVNAFCGSSAGFCRQDPRQKS